MQQFFKIKSKLSYIFHTSAAPSCQIIGSDIMRLVGLDVLLYFMLIISDRTGNYWCKCQGLYKAFCNQGSHGGEAFWDRHISSSPGQQEVVQAAPSMFDFSSYRAGCTVWEHQYVFQPNKNATSLQTHENWVKNSNNGRAIHRLF